MASISFSSNRYFQNWQDFHNHKDIEERLHNGYQKWQPSFPIDLPSEEDIQKMTSWAKGVKDAGIDVLVIMGMGGSSLGAKAVRDVVDYWDESLFFWEGPHPSVLSKVRKFLDGKNAAVLWVSKSGTTLETRTALSLFRQFFPGVPEYFVTSKPEKIADLGATAENTFHIPENLGGRYSVISPVGLMPALFLGADVNELIEGFKSGLEQWDISIPLDANPAKDVALQYYQSLQGCYQSVVFWVYSYQLMGWGRWLIQLWGESVGKTPAVRALPYLTQGPEDQHSMLQFFQEGPNQFVHTFVHTQTYGSLDMVIPNELAGEAGDHTLWEILQSQMKSIQYALTEGHRPVTEVLLPEINLHQLGRMFSFWMYVVAYIGYLYGVNPFDQPGVEKGKVYAKKLLNNVEMESVLREVRSI